MKSKIDDYIRINPQTGLYEPIYWKRAMLPYKLTFDPQYVPTGLLTVAASGDTTAIFKQPHTSTGLDGGFGSPLLITQTTFEDSTDSTASALFTISLKDLGDMTQFMNQPIHILNFAGTAQLAAKMPEPLFLPSKHALQAKYAKTSGIATTMRHFFDGKLFMPFNTDLIGYPEDKRAMLTLLSKLTERRRHIFPFWLTTDLPVVVPANGTLEVETAVGDDGHFEATHIIATSTGEFTVNILNPETKQAFTNGQLSSAAGIGTAQNPQKLATSWLIPAGKKLRFQFTDTSGSSNTIHICLRGRRFRANLLSGDDVSKLFKTVKQMDQDLRIPKEAVA